MEYEHPPHDEVENTIDIEIMKKGRTPAYASTLLRKPSPITEEWVSSGHRDYDHMEWIA